MSINNYHNYQIYKFRQKIGKQREKFFFSRLKKKKSILYVKLSCVSMLEFHSLYLFCVRVCFSKEDLYIYIYIYKIEIV